jgi:hypothetical protein
MPSLPCQGGTCGGNTGKKRQMLCISMFFSGFLFTYSPNKVFFERVFSGKKQALEKFPRHCLALGKKDGA